MQLKSKEKTNAAVNNFTNNQHESLNRLLFHLFTKENVPLYTIYLIIIQHDT